MLIQLVIDGLLGKFLHANATSPRWALGGILMYVTCFVTQQIFCCLFFVSGLREDIEGGSGGKIWKEDLEGGFGRRTWKEDLEGGPGRRIWKEDLEGGPGRRIWKEDLEGRPEGRTCTEDMH
jgi:hypothetical protein